MKKYNWHLPGGLLKASKIRMVPGKNQILMVAYLANPAMLMNNMNRDGLGTNGQLGANLKWEIVKGLIVSIQCRSECRLLQWWLLQ